MPAVRIIPRQFFDWNASGAVTVAAQGANQNVNLSPSGSGFTSLASGYLSIGTAQDVRWGTTSYAAVKGTAGSSGVALQFIGGASEIFRAVVGGSVLFGTPTDSGNGRIQLATHTTSGGGIGFGTDTSLFRSAAGVLVLNHTGLAPLINFSENGAVSALIGTNTGVMYIDNRSIGTSTLFRTNGTTTALTLDPSQNTIAAGSIATAAPTGGAGVWKLGKYTAGALAAAGYITVNIDGTDRRLLVG